MQNQYKKNFNQSLTIDERNIIKTKQKSKMCANELKTLKTQGKTIILSTHNMRSVEEICDRAALIHNSKKLAEDSVWNLRDSQKSGEFSIRFSGNMIAFANALWTDFELIDNDLAWSINEATER